METMSVNRRSKSDAADAGAELALSACRWADGERIMTADGRAIGKCCMFHTGSQAVSQLTLFSSWCFYCSRALELRWDTALGYLGKTLDDLKYDLESRLIHLQLDKVPR
jgi:hypothetical protein